MKVVINQLVRHALSIIGKSLDHRNSLVININIKTKYKKKKVDFLPTILHAVLHQDHHTDGGGTNTLLLIQVMQVHVYIR